jgi:ribosomal protein S12 methylthiotransferase accessory factor
MTIEGTERQSLHVGLAALLDTAGDIGSVGKTTLTASGDVAVIVGSEICVAAIASASESAESELVALCVDRPAIVLAATELGVYVSPLFIPDTKPCPGCLLRRMRATEISLISPVLDDETARSVARLVERVLVERPAMKGYLVNRSGDARTQGLLPVPICPNCREYESRECDLGGRPIEETVLSRCTGIVRAAFNASPNTPVLPIHGIGAWLASTDETLGHPGSRITGGQNLDDVLALRAALGEAVERYARSWVSDELVLDTARGIGSAAVAPETWEFFTHQQYRQRDFRFVPFTDATPVYWMPARSPFDDREMFVPAQLSLRESVTLPGDTPIFFAQTTGTACSDDWRTAATRALDELLERDALMVLWRNQLCPPRIILHEDAEGSAMERLAVTSAAYKLRACDLSDISLVPTVLVEYESQEGLSYTAYAVSHSFQHALDKAILELTNSVNNLLEVSPPIPQNPDQIRTFEDHTLYYHHPRRRHLTRFIADGTEPRSRTTAYDTAPETFYERMLAAYAVAGIEVFLCDITPPDVRALGLHVCRAVSPNIVQMEREHRFASYAPQRLTEIPERIAWTARPGWERGRLCKLPHPF